MRGKESYIWAATVVIVIALIIFGFSRRAGDEGSLIEDEREVDTVSATTTAPTSQTPSTRGPATPNPLIPTQASPESQTSSNPSGAEVSTSVKNLDGSIYKLVTYNGASLSSNDKFFISFDADTLTAKFCNNISGYFILDGNLLKATNLVGTKMYCFTPANLMDIETAFISMLNMGATVYEKGSTITLSRSQGAVMVFEGL